MGLYYGKNWVGHHDPKPSDRVFWIVTICKFFVLVGSIIFIVKSCTA